MQKGRLNATLKTVLTSGGAQRARRVAARRAKEAARHERPLSLASEARESSALAAFAREVGRVPLLEAEDEQRLAREIEAGEVEMWTRILSYRPALELAVGRVRAAAGADAPEGALQQLESAGGEVARQAAEQVREADRDREALDEVLEVLERMAAGQAELPAGAARDEVARLWTELDELDHQVGQVRNQFIESNIRLVFAIAAQYRRGDMPLADLVQEGTMGLMVAVNRFDYRRGLRFSTYAGWWIRHMIGRASADKARNVRVPVYLRESKQRLERTQRELTMQLGRAPTDEELSAASGISIPRMWSVRALVGSHEISLDQTLGEDQELSRHDVFRDPYSTEQPVDQLLALRQEARWLESAFDKLRPQEADILRKRFALEGDHEWTLNEIAQRYGVTRERIRQVQNRALLKLRKELAALREVTGD